MVVDKTGRVVDRDVDENVDEGGTVVIVVVSI